MRFEIWPPRRKPALIPHELLCKRVSQGGISKAPTNCPTSIISATVTALRGTGGRHGFDPGKVN